MRKRRAAAPCSCCEAGSVAAKAEAAAAAEATAARRRRTSPRGDAAPIDIDLLCHDETLSITPDAVTAHVGDVDGEVALPLSVAAAAVSAAALPSPLLMDAPLLITAAAKPYGGRRGVPKMLACDAREDTIRGDGAWVPMLRPLPRAGHRRHVAQWLSGGLLGALCGELVSAAPSAEARAGMGWQAALPREAWSVDTLFLLVADVLGLFRAAAASRDVPLDDIPHPDMPSSALNGRQATMAACLFLVCNEWYQGVLTIAMCLALCEPEGESFLVDDMRVWSRCSTVLPHAKAGETRHAARATPSPILTSRTLFLSRVVATMTALELRTGERASAASASRGRVLPHMVSRRVVSMLSDLQHRDGGAALDAVLATVERTCFAEPRGPAHDVGALRRAVDAMPRHERDSAAVEVHVALQAAAAPPTAEGAHSEARLDAAAWVRDVVIRGRLACDGTRVANAAMRAVVLGELRRVADSSDVGRCAQRRFLRCVLQEIVESLVAYFVWSITMFGVGDAQPDDDAGGFVRADDVVDAACFLVDAVVGGATLPITLQCARGVDGARVRRVADLALRHVTHRRLSGGFHEACASLAEAVRSGGAAHNLAAVEAMLLIHLFGADGDEDCAAMALWLWDGLDARMRELQQTRATFSHPPMRWRFAVKRRVW